MKPGYPNAWKQSRRTNYSALRQRRAAVERLEDRRLLSGLTLVVNEPRSILENAGPSATTATVSRVGLDTSQNLTVSLVSNDTTEATVPAGVVIPAGDASFTFPIAAVDDALLDGTQTVTVTATASAAVSLDPTFGSGGLAPAGIEQSDAMDLAVQSDGKLLTLGNDPSAAAAWRLARLNSDGSPDTTFGAGGAVTTLFPNSTGGFPSAMAVQPDGGIIVVGAVDGGSSSSTDFGMARYLPTGSLDASFGTGGLMRMEFSSESRWLTDVDLAPDGKILVSGSSNRPSMGFQLARFNANGTLDTSFGTGGIVTNDLYPTSNPDYAQQVERQSDGKILLAGRTGHGDGQNGEFAVFRYNDNGTLDTAFSGDGVQTIFVGAYNVYHLAELAVQTDGRILLGGYVRNGSVGSGAAIRLNTNGTLDTTFDGDGTKLFDVGSGTMFRAMSLDAAGKIILSGSGYSDTTTGTDLNLARLNPDGSLDPSFDGDGKKAVSLAPYPRFEAIYATGFQAGGQLVALLAADGVEQAARFNLDGETYSAAATLDVTDYETLSVSVSPGTVLEGGTAGVTIARSNTDISQELAVALASSDAGEATVPAAATIPAGQASVTVNLDAVDDGVVDGPQTVTIRASAGGYADGAGTLTVADSPVLSLVITADEVAENAGAGATTAVVRRRNVDLSQPLTVWLSSSDESEAIAPMTAVIAAGEESAEFFLGAVDDAMLDGTQTVTITAEAALGVGGELAVDTTFGQSGNGNQKFHTRAVAVQPDGCVLAAGFHYTGAPANYHDFGIARLTPIGSADTTFNGTGTVFDDVTGDSDQAQAIAVQPDGKIVVGGKGQYNGKWNFLLTRYLPDGSRDSTFGTGGIAKLPDTFGNSEVWDVFILPDGKILAGGMGPNGFLVARFTSSGALDATFGGDGISGAGSGFGTAMALQDDGKIVMIGSKDRGNSFATIAAVRFTSDGQLDSSFDGDGLLSVNLPGNYDNPGDVAIQADGKIVIAGYSAKAGVSPMDYDCVLARYNADGSLDTTFGDAAAPGFAVKDFGGLTDQAYGLAIASDGTILVVGQATPTATSTIARFRADGQFESSITATGSATTNSDDTWADDIVLGADGRVFTGSWYAYAFPFEPGFVTAYTSATLVAASDTLQVTDYETLTVTTAFDSVAENWVTVQATVTRSNSENLGAALTVSLTSSDTTEITVPASVTIPAGALSVNFVVGVVNDTLLDGTQQAAITASAGGYVSGSKTISVTDYETLDVALGKASLAVGGDSTTATLTRSNTDVDAPLTVNIFYEQAPELVCPDTVTIPAGQQSVTFDVSTTDNGIVEGTRTARLWMSAAGYVSSAGKDLEIREEGVLGLAVAADGFASDSNLDGVFETLDTTWNKIHTLYYPNPNIHQESRGLFEFDLAGLDPAAAIEAASLTVQVAESAMPANGTTVVELYGYAADGVLKIEDATAGTVKLGELAVPPGIQGLRRYGVPLDAAFLESARGGYLGIRARVATTAYVDVYSKEATSIHPSNRPMLQMVLNHPPIANDQSVTTDEDVPASIVLTASDVDGDAMTYTVIAGPAHGTLSGAAPNLTYTPAANFNGADSFTFKVNDGSVDSALATVSITVAPVNDPPVAYDASVSTDEDTVVSFTLPATDVDGDPLVYRVATAPSHGSLSVQGSTATYTPWSNYFGADSFTFKAVDGFGQGAQSNVAAVSIEVRPVEDVPVAQSDSYAMYHDRTRDVYLQASDADGDPLTFVIVTWPSHGTLVHNDGAPAWYWIYTPDPGYAGNDAFTFKANDGKADSNVATISLRITLVHPGAVPTVGVYDENEEQPNTVDFVAAGSSLTNAEFAAGVLAAYEQDFGGVLDASALAFKWAYGVHEAKALDITRAELTNYGVGGTSGAALPISKTGAYVTSDYEQSNYNCLSLDFGPIENAALREHVVEFGLTALSSPGVDYGTVTVTGRLAEGGTMIASRPINDGYGLGDTFYGLTAPVGDYFAGFSLSYDGAVNKPLWFDDLGFRTATVNHPPVADGQTVTVGEDGSATITLTGSDADGDALTYTVVTGPAHGAITGTAPNLTYTPAGDYNGADSFTFKVNDGSVDSAEAMIGITVAPVNDAPALTVSGPAVAVRGQSCTFEFNASDPLDGDPAEQQFSYSITWDDGASQTVSGGSSIQVEHAFASVRPGGTYTVTATVTDEAGSGLTSDLAAASTEIYGAEIQGGDLVVVGTSASDSIQIKPADTGGNLAVFIAGQSQGVFHPSGWINVYALAGDDTVQVQSAKIGKKTVSVTLPAAIFGADGSDVLDVLGSKASNILAGGDGDDTITANSGRDLLFGGLGADTLRGGSGDDILVAGPSAYDADHDALRAIWDEWTRTDADYTTRVGHLRGTIAGGRNEGHYLTESTVSDDAAIDQLFGQSGNDWFFCRLSGNLEDSLDRKRSEEVTLI